MCISVYVYLLVFNESAHCAYPPGDLCASMRLSRLITLAAFIVMINRISKAITLIGDKQETEYKLKNK